MINAKAGKQNEEENKQKLKRLKETGKEKAKIEGMKENTRRWKVNETRRTGRV